MTQPEEIPWPDPPECCPHPAGVHSTRACQEPGCPCTPVSYRRKVAARPKPIPAPSAMPEEMTEAEQGAWRHGYTSALVDVAARLNVALDELGRWEP